MEAPFNYKRRVPYIVLLVNADIPLVRSWGGVNVTDQFFDNDRRASLAGGCESPYYDFIDGEPYSRWQPRHH